MIYAGTVNSIRHDYLDRVPCLSEVPNRSPRHRIGVVLTTRYPFRSGSAGPFASVPSKVSAVTQSDMLGSTSAERRPATGMPRPAANAGWTS